MHYRGYQTLQAYIKKPANVIEYLPALFKRFNFIHYLDLSNCSLGNKDFNIILKLLQRQNLLRSLNISHNGIGFRHQLYQNLLTFIQKHKSLEYINLANNELSDKHIFELVNYLEKCSLIALGLANNNVMHFGFYSLLEALSTHSQLKELDLTANNIAIHSDEIAIDTIRNYALPPLNIYMQMNYLTRLQLEALPMLQQKIFPDIKDSSNELSRSFIKPDSFISVKDTNIFLMVSKQFDHLQPLRNHALLLIEGIATGQKFIYRAEKFRIQQTQNGSIKIAEIRPDEVTAILKNYKYQVFSVAVFKAKKLIANIIDESLSDGIKYSLFGMNCLAFCLEKLAVIEIEPNLSLLTGYLLIPSAAFSHTSTSKPLSYSINNFFKPKEKPHPTDWQIVTKQNVLLIPDEVENLSFFSLN